MAKWPPPIYYHNSSGQARCRIDGKDYYLGKYGSPEAAAAYAKLVADLAAGKEPARARDSRATPLTVAQVVADWQTRVLPSYDPAGREPGNFRLSLHPLLIVAGSLPAADFDAARLDAVRAEMVKKGWCRTTVNQRVNRVRLVWRWAETQGFVPRGSWAHLCTLPGLRRNNHAVRQTEKVRPAAWETVRAVLRECQPVVRAMLLLQWHSGMRSGEVRLMRKEEVDTAAAVWLYRPASHKTAHLGQDRVIALGRKGQAVLRTWLARADEWVFTARGQPYLRQNYARAVRRAALRAGVAGFWPYQCRHAFKLRVTREYGLDAARALLGQMSLGTTNSYASQIDLKTATDVARKLG